MSYDEYDNYAGNITEWPKPPPPDVWEEYETEQPSRIGRVLWIFFVVICLVICGVTR